jgi:arsenite/tail-anchored protein-transporting ATPase
MPPKSVDPLHCLSSTRVAVVIGKGGVGKTTVTAVLARAAAQRGLRVAVVELDGKPVLNELLAGTDVEVMQLTAADALAEYLDSHGLGRVSKRLASSGVIDVVATAAPGIDDIVVLGKIKQLERSGTIDLVIVDGPAAGHAVTFLQSATSLQATVRGGPVRTQANEVATMLADPARCQVVLVTLAETTPVNEAIETAFTLEDRVGTTLGAIVVNGVDIGDSLPTDDAESGTAIAAAARFRNARRALHAAERSRLADLLAFPQVTLPQLPTSMLAAADVASLAAALAPGSEDG